MSVPEEPLIDRIEPQKPDNMPNCRNFQPRRETHVDWRKVSKPLMTQNLTHHPKSMDRGDSVVFDFVDFAVNCFSRRSESFIGPSADMVGRHIEHGIAANSHEAIFSEDRD
jgi:hypothetical protein